MKAPHAISRALEPLLLNDYLYQTPLEIIELLASTYSHISADSNFDADFFTRRQHTENTPINFFIPPNSSSLDYNHPISENEVRKAIYQCAKSSAPGHYQITPLLLQKLHNNAIIHFTALLNRISHQHIFHQAANSP